MVENAIPFRKFDGFLKQIALENLSSDEKDLFDMLFPQFNMESGSREAAEKLKKHPLYKAASPLIEVQAADERPRRFAGYNFPRSRYYVISPDIDEIDQHSLAHELRAYRNPMSIGMVEVIDLAAGCILGIKGENIKLSPEHSLGVLIHPYSGLPSQFKQLNLQVLPGLKSQASYLFRIPYNVSNKCIERTIDLRLPEVRKWFYETFKIPGETEYSISYSADMEPLVDSTIAYSRFHLEDGRAPVPHEFWGMFPTLINPDLGGGGPAVTGSTLHFIGQWMRSVDVSAFIYPSARCDSSVVYYEGNLNSFAGWNLVYYEDAPICSVGVKVNVMTFDPSPWAWISFPKGVVLNLPKSQPEFVGSFAITGMVDYWAKDYLDQIEALEIAREIHGAEGKVEPSSAMALRIWHIGRLVMKWLRMFVEGESSVAIRRNILELQGLAIPYNLYALTGRVSEEWGKFKEGGEFGSCLLANIRVTSLVESAISKRYPNSELEKLVVMASDIEWIILSIGIKIKTKNIAAIENDIFSPMINEIQNIESCCWLEQSLWEQLKRFVTESIEALSGPSFELTYLLEKEQKLQERVAIYLKECNQ